MAVGHQALVGVQPMLCQRQAVGSQSRASVTRHVLLAARDEGDAPVTVPDEMCHRSQDAARVIRDECRAILAGTDELHRMPGAAHLLEVV